MLNPYKFHTDPKSLFGYEYAVKNIPAVAWSTYTRQSQRKKLEHLWARDPQTAYEYALGRGYELGRGPASKPFPAGEPAIATRADLSYYYALNVLHARFPAGEDSIAKYPGWAQPYAHAIIRGPFPEAENAIKDSAHYSYYYAIEVLKDRFKAGEPAIARDPEYRRDYKTHFGVNLP